MDSSLSLSQGCFAYKRKHQQTLSNKKQPKSAPATDSLSRRLNIFRDVWENVVTKFKETQARVFSNTLDDLKSFLSSKSENIPTESLRHGEIPTALFVTGANVSDHTAVFTSLRQMIVSSMSPFVVSLRSKECPNIKSAVKKIGADLIGGSANEDDDEVNVTKAKFTMSMLAAWYKHQNAKMKRSTPRKQRKIGNGLPGKFTPKSIYIILENFESFDPSVIENFVLLISEYSAKLPVVFVFGVSTTPSTVHQILSQASSSRLAMHTFRYPNPDFSLDLIVTTLLQMGSVFPLKLGNRLFQLLENNFVLDTLSCEAFVAALKVCFMEHYYSNSWSGLCGRAVDIPHHAESLDKEALEDIRRLASFRGYVDGRQLKEQCRLLVDDKHLRSSVKLLVTEIVNYGNNFYPILSLLRVLTLNLPKRPFGGQMRDLYSVCLDCEVAESKQFEEVVKLLGLMDREGLLEKLKSGRKIIGANNELSDEMAKVDESLRRFVERLTKLGDDQEEKEHRQQKAELKLGHVMNRQELMQTLKDHAKTNKSKSPFHILREEIVAFIEITVRWYLRNYRRLPLHEIMYCDSYDSVKQQLLGNARGAVLLALSNPHHYLKCECCELTDIDDIQPSLPNISIMYKLHLESGRMINLYDWLQSYLQILEASKCTGRNIKSKEEEIRQRSVTTFAQAVSELQHLGFLKQTQRKTDHVARLTW